MNEKDNEIEYKKKKEEESVRFERRKEVKEIKRMEKVGYGKKDEDI